MVTTPLIERRLVVGNLGSTVHYRYYRFPLHVIRTFFTRTHQEEPGRRGPEMQGQDNFGGLPHRENDDVIVVARLNYVSVRGQACSLETAAAGDAFLHPLRDNKDLGRRGNAHSDDQTSPKEIDLFPHRSCGDGVLRGGHLRRARP